MDPKYKWKVTGEKENEILLDDKEGEIIDSRSGKTKKDVKKKKRVKKIVNYDIDVSSSLPKEEDNDSFFQKNIWLNKTTLLIIPTFCTTLMLIYYLYLLASPSL
jgi:hypothetical protein